eukprot:8951024-Lingulodinium_polyedra.AAC.1
MAERHAMPSHGMARQVIEQYASSVMMCWCAGVMVYASAHTFDRATLARSIARARVRSCVFARAFGAFDCV